VTPPAESAATALPASAALEPLDLRQKLRLLGAFVGPAFVASIAYMDPGNFATNIQAGSQFGYALLWVLLWSNAMAILIQTLSAKLGIASGLTLPQACRRTFRRPVVIGLWVAAELAALATDLAEFLGAALGFHLLVGLDLFPSAVATGVLVFAILAIERRGARRFEAVIIAFVGVIGLAYAFELFLAHPSGHAVATGTVVPHLSSSALYVAVAMIGATVMPHVVYLHSGLVLPRRGTLSPKRHLRLERTDIVLAMNGAWLINSAMVVMAAAVFYGAGVSVGSIEDAHQTLNPLLGSVSAAAFGVALLASGISSSTVGTMAGQMILEGFMDVRMSIFLRRLITMVPALVVIGIGLDPLSTLIASQAALSIALPFALVPLVMLTSRRELMGTLVNRRITQVAGWAITIVVVSLNLLLLAQIALG
jgi:manganese transport protein